MYYSAYPVYPYYYPRVTMDSYRFPEQYPEVNTDMLKTSAEIYHDLLKEADKIIQQLKKNEFAYQIMSAAQQNDQAKVDHLIHSIEGVDGPIEVHYTPFSIRFDLMTQEYADKKSDCCSLNISLRWGL